MSGLIDDHELTRRRLLQVAGSGALALGLAACGGSGTNTTAGGASGASSGPIRRGGTLTVGWLSGGAAESLDPASGTQQPDFFRVFNLYDSLWTRGRDGRPQLRLLESGETNADATVWTLRLRDGVTFHNGKPLTADDLLYTIKSWSNPKHGGNAIASSTIDFAGVRKRDKLTVEVPLQFGVTEFPSLLTRLNFVVIQNGSNPAKDPIGTGPFMLESFEPGKRSVYARNPDYWREGRPYVDQLVIDTSFTDDQPRLNALLAGQIDAMPQMPFTQARSMEASGEIALVNSPAPQIMTFPMHCRTAPFDDERVRRALKLVVDRQQMVDNIFSGFATVGNDLSPVGVPYFADDLKVERDVEQAKSLLKAAGYEDLTIPFYTSNAFPGQSEASVLLKEQAAEAGITVDLKRVTAANFFTETGGWLTYPMSCDLWLSPMASLTQFWNQLLYTKAAFNQTYWATPETDRLLRDVMSDTDEASAGDKWRALQERQFDTGGYLTFAQPNYVDGTTKRVRGIEPSGAGYLGGFILDEAWLDG